MPDGPRDGVVATRHEWIKKLKGEVKLDAGAVPNFFCPNINVEVRSLVAARRRGREELMRTFSTSS